MELRGLIRTRGLLAPRPSRTTCHLERGTEPPVISSEAPNHLSSRARPSDGRVARSPPARLSLSRWGSLDSLGSLGPSLTRDDRRFVRERDRDRDRLRRVFGSSYSDNKKPLREGGVRDVRLLWLTSRRGNHHRHRRRHRNAAWPGPRQRGWCDRQARCRSGRPSPCRQHHHLQRSRNRNRASGRCRGR